MEQTFVDTTAGIRALPGLEMQRRQLEEQRRYREEIAKERAEQNRIRREQVAAEFGPYAVTGPDGELDIRASARAQQSAKQAAELGQAEALSGQSFADIPQDIRNLPEYRQGWASGMASRAVEEERFGRQSALQEQRGQTAEEVARIRNENTQLRSLLAGEKSAPGELVDISEEVEGLGKVSRKVPASDLPTLREAALRRREEKPVRDAIQGLKGALREIEGVKGDKVSIDFPQGKEPKVDSPMFGGMTKATARKELKARIQNLEGLLGRTVGQEGDGATKPDLRPPGPRVPQGTNPPSGAGIVQPRGTNVFNVMRDPSGAWKVY
jgi:hypothetical protein